MKMILLCVVGFFVFSVALGFWMGWYVRGAYPGRKWRDALAVALMHSTLTIKSGPMVDILGQKLVDELERKAEKALRKKAKKEKIG